MVVSTFPTVPSIYASNQLGERIEEVQIQNRSNVKIKRSQSRLNKPKPRGTPQPPKNKIDVNDKAFRIVYLEENRKSNPLIPEDFVAPVERARKCKSIGGISRLPTLETLQQDKRRSVWTNQVGAKRGEPVWKNDTNGCKMFLASQYRGTDSAGYHDPAVYNTKLLPQQYNASKDTDCTSIHPPDLVDPRNALSLTQQEHRRQKTISKHSKPKKIIPPWDNSPQNVVEHLLWRKSQSLR